MELNDRRAKNSMEEHSSFRGGVIGIKKGYFFIIVIAAAMLLISQTHLKETFGDLIFETIGISPWTKSNQNGMHLPVIAGLFLMIIGVAGAQRTLRDRHPKLTGTILIGCIAFFFIFPFITQGIMYAVKYNASDTNSVHVTDSKCNFTSIENKVTAECSFKVFNYGKAEELVIKPVLPTNWNRSIDIDFGAIAVKLDRHSEQSMTIQFKGTQNNGSGFTGWGQDIRMEVVSTSTAKS
jgi:hypothetical protein